MACEVPAPGNDGPAVGTSAVSPETGGCPLDLHGAPPRRAGGLWGANRMRLGFSRLAKPPSWVLVMSCISSQAPVLVSYLDFFF